MSLERRSILVAGDLMLDQYTVGQIRRISPEAPVPVLNPESSESRPGGAGNAALNLVSLGQQVRLFGRLGADPSGDLLRSLLDEEGIDTRFLQIEEEWPTPVKNRLVASGQQVLRIDTERNTPFEPPTLDFEALLAEIDAVAISDYAKGFLTPPLLRALISAAREREIPVLVDPKGRDYSRYQGATLIKPNLLELTEAAGLGAEATLDELAQAVIEKTSISSLLVTRSEKGISIFSPQGREDFPAHVREVRDVTGAGDTVLAVLTAAAAAQIELGEAAQLANRAAGLAIERFGCARITHQELFSEDHTKIFT